jgi:hypothetical protein
VTSPAHFKPAAVATAATATAKASSPKQRLDRSLPPVKHDPELKAKHKRPKGWVAPGPQPAAAAAAAGGFLDPDLIPGLEETLSYLTGDWRIFQLRNGHRCVLLAAMPPIHSHCSLLAHSTLALPHPTVTILSVAASSRITSSLRVVPASERAANASMICALSLDPLVAWLC